MVSDKLTRGILAPMCPNCQGSVCGVFGVLGITAFVVPLLPGKCVCVCVMNLESSVSLVALHPNCLGNNYV